MHTSRVIEYLWAVNIKISDFPDRERMRKAGSLFKKLPNLSKTLIPLLQQVFDPQLPED